MVDMQPIRCLIRELEALSSDEHYLFSSHDLRALLLELSPGAYKTLLSRAVQQGHLERVCRGLYLYPKAVPLDGYMLFRIATRLRVREFNYLSLESVLSDAGVISQIPLRRIFIMSSGRSNVIHCGRWGSIEFVHTAKKPAALAKDLSYDFSAQFWRASLALALRDIQAARRSLDLINWSVVDELIRSSGR